MSTSEPDNVASSDIPNLSAPSVARSTPHWYRFCPTCATPVNEVGQVPLRCEQCGFANFFGPVAAVGGLIVDHEDRLLMVIRAQDPGKGKWGLPGGFVDANESIETALRREVREETQLELSSLNYLMSRPNQYNYRGIVGWVIDLFYVCRADDESKIVLASKELTGYQWVADPTENIENMAFSSNRIAIKAWMENRG